MEGNDMKPGGAFTVAALIMSLALVCIFTPHQVAAENAPAKAMMTANKPDLAAVKSKLRADAQVQDAKGRADFQTRRAKFQQAQKARLDARNLQAMTELQRLKANAEQIKKIRVEVAQLNARLAAASPEDLETIDRRAGELQAQLDRLGY